ncbi:MAG: hypothetical protein JO104_11355 [Candidatus Eremiobacteraeota bacterium]|nr:hypothetical protein [Candidatus Eremiobacteraeota bacterium]
MTARALRGVLRARLYAQRRAVLYACAAAFVVGLLAPAGLAGPIFFCTLLGIALAMAQTPGLHPYLDRCEQSAPLFGRELARAKALVPCVAAALSVIVYTGAAFFHAAADAPTFFGVALAAVIASTLVALSATIRRGSLRALYIALAGTTSAIAFALVVEGHSVWGELAFCTIVAFFALRQYGETLARYDPI